MATRSSVTPNPSDLMPKVRDKFIAHMKAITNDDIIIENMQNLGDAYWVVLTIKSSYGGCIGTTLKREFYADLM